MKSQEIILFPGIKLGETDIPITFTSRAKEIQPGQYQIWDYKFESRNDANGCFFIFPPGTQSNIALVNRKGTEIIQRVTYGSGYCIRTRNMPGMVDAQRQQTIEISLHIGQTLTFYADDIYVLGSFSKGMVIQDTTSPPFQLGITEINLKPDDPRLPLSFSRTIRELQSSSLNTK